jgi:DNA replication and repair protein RecF
VILTELTVQNYRNIAEAHFVPGRELTVICGQNGQGKTNLLEAVWLLTGGKSFRGGKDSELIREGESFAVVEGRTEGAGRENNVRIVVSDGQQGRKGRSARVNGVDYGRASSAAGTFTAVVFDPGHLSLIKGSPEGRRKFLDAALCQLYPQYLTLYRQYTRLVTQKNALLKAYAQTRDAEALLDVFDERLAQTGTEISERRRAYLERITPHVVQTYRDISSAREALAMYYEPCFTEKETLAQVLRRTRGRDMAAGFCTAGPHKEDFVLQIDGRVARTFASQGQQRSAVLSLKLAEAAAAQEITGEHPVMLLDDVLSELDETRQAYLLSCIAHRQTIVTACDAGLFHKTQGRVYTVQNGALYEGAAAPL